MSTSLDEMAVYFFVRGDLREEDQMVQVSHAILEMALSYDPAFAKYRIVGLDGGQSEQAFNKTRRKMNDRHIPHVEYSDPDFPELGVTAIATIPLTKEQASPLANYRLRRYSPPSGASPEVAAKASGEPVQHASVAQETEHSTFSREVVGGIPTGSSTSEVTA